MQQFIVSAEDDQKRLVRVLTKHFNQVPAHRFQKALKNRDIRIDQQRVKTDCPVYTGQVISVYLPDEQLQGLKPVVSYDILYEDKALLILNKPQGVTVHPGQGTREGETLIEALRARYGEAVTLLHRLDRNTGGLLVVAKTKTALGKLNEVVKQGQMVKRYRCLVKGLPELGEPILLDEGDLMYETRAYWERPDQADAVYIHSEARPGDLEVITRYRVLQVLTHLGCREPVSELEVELVTGRTHQIRAHLAFLGHPILGDGKYGRNEFNLQFKNRKGGKVNVQQLFATSIHFGPKLPDGLQGVAGKTFRIQPDYALTGVKPAK